MSSLILPPWYHTSGGIIQPQNSSHSAQEIRIPKPEIPRQLQLDLEANARLEPKFYESIGQALSAALADPDTRPKQTLTEALLKEWTELCYEVILIMRYDLKYALTRCFDILPDEFVQALKAGVRIADIVERTQHGCWWKRSGAEDEQMLVKEEVKGDGPLSEKQEEAIHQAQEVGNGLYEEVHGDSKLRNPC